jgi:hypothetical protein
MFDNNDLPNGGVQFTISHEVIAFLRWLIVHHPDELKSLAKKSLHDGFWAHITKYDTTSADDQDIEKDKDTQATLLDFFGMIEILLLEAIEEYMAKQAKQTQLQPTLDQIDTAFCDTITVKSSLEHVTKTYAADSNISARELLFRELLKQWRPHKSQLLN